MNSFLNMMMCHHLVYWLIILKYWLHQLIEFHNQNFWTIKIKIFNSSTHYSIWSIFISKYACLRKKTSLRCFFCCRSNCQIRTEKENLNFFILGFWTKRKTFFFSSPVKCLPKWSWRNWCDPLANYWFCLLESVFLSVYSPDIQRCSKIVLTAVSIFIRIRKLLLVRISLLVSVRLII